MIFHVGKPSDSKTCQIKGCEETEGLKDASTGRKLVKLCPKHFAEAYAGKPLIVRAD